MISLPFPTTPDKARVARTQGTFRFVTVYEAGKISGLPGCSDFVCQRGYLEDDSFPDREPLQFLQYRRDVFISTTANYQASQCVLISLSLVDVGCRNAL